jgi:IS5 family transposase
MNADVSSAKVSVATTLARSKGGQLIAHVKTLPGDPCDGRTLKTVIPEIETQIGASLVRIVADHGYRGHNAPPDPQMKVLSPARSAASPRPSSATYAAARRSSPSSATPNPSTA